jgi:hypothetical protein
MTLFFAPSSGWTSSSLNFLFKLAAWIDGPLDMGPLDPTPATFFSDVKVFFKTVSGYNLQSAEGHRVLEWLLGSNPSDKLSILTCYRHM